jgi:teichuronic acid biosynthesis glycosyltransferase TuaG
MPAYNCIATVGAAIDSALAQEVPLEVIVVDDCSPQDLTEVLAPYREDPRVKILRNETNLGAAGSRNVGVAAATGEYIAFLDADDIWAPEKLQKQLALIREKDSVLCATARELMTPEGELTGRVIPVKETITYKELLKHNSINCSSVLMKAEVAKAFPMEHEDSHEDYILWLKILQKYGFACAVNEPLLRYRLSNTGKSGSKLHSAKMTFKVYRYMGFGTVSACLLFASYAFHGVMKYALSFLKK